MSEKSNLLGDRMLIGARHELETSPQVTKNFKNLFTVYLLQNNRVQQRGRNPSCKFSMSANLDVGSDTSTLLLR